MHKHICISHKFTSLPQIYVFTHFFYRAKSLVRYKKWHVYSSMFVMSFYMCLFVLVCKRVLGYRSYRIRLSNTFVHQFVFLVRRWLMTHLLNSLICSLVLSLATYTLNWENPRPLSQTNDRPDIYDDNVLTMSSLHVAHHYKYHNNCLRWGRSWYSGGALESWSTGSTIDLAPFILLAQVVLGPV